MSEINRDELARDMQQFTGRVCVNVSGGIGSATAWKICLDYFGSDRTEAVFADTASESDDTYRFLDECERAFQHPLHRVRQLNDDGTPMNIWDCFEKYGVTKIMATGACKASVELKQKPLMRFMQEQKLDAFATGLSPWIEPDRCLKLIDKRREFNPLFPLVLVNQIGYCSQQDLVRSWGIKVPEAYEFGAPHNNCQQHGCILQGIKQWASFLKSYPDRYASTEERSNAFYERTGFALMRDRRGGETKPYTLTQLREDIQAGREIKSGWQSNCSCMEPQ